MKILYDTVKDKTPKEKLRLYRNYNALSFLLHQELKVFMEDYLSYQCKDDDAHCFIIEIKDTGKYILVHDYFHDERISEEIIFKFAEEFGLRLESISYEVTEIYDDLSKKHHVYNSNHCIICYELLK